MLRNGPSGSVGRGLFACLLAMTVAGAAQAQDIVVNEIMQNPSAVSDADGEWFEVVNTTGAAIDINGWTIQDLGSDSHVITNGGPLMVPANGFLVLADNGDSGTNGGVTVDYVYSGITLANGDDELVLFDSLFTEIDRVEWDGGPGFPDPNGATMTLNDPANDNNVGANWCEGSVPFGSGDLGTPGSANSCPVILPEIIINEIIQNPDAVSDADGEWFELHNAGTTDVDIDGWTILDDGTDSHVISNGGPLLVSAGGFLVLADNGDSLLNGGVTVDYVYSGITLANGADEVVLLDTDLTEIDRVNYDDGLTFPDPTGATMSLIDPSLDNNVGTNWCEAVTPFGDGDLGTPGAANVCTVALDVVVINEIIQNPDAVGDADGEWFEVFNPGATDVDIEGWTIQDDGTDGHVISNGGPLLVPAGGFLVLADNGDSLLNGGVAVDYVYSGITLANGADEVVLLDAGLNEIDRVNYDDGLTFPDPTGATMSLIDPGLDNNVGANWCEGSTPFGDGDLGTPGAANDCAVSAGELVINEIDYDQDGTDAAEFVEIKNVGGAPADLNGFTLEFVNGSSGATYDTIVLPAQMLGAGEYFVVCGDSANVFNCNLDDGPDTNFIQNGAPDAVALLFGGAIVDTVSYEGDVAGFVEGSGSGLEDDSNVDNSGISRFPDGGDTDQNNVDLSARCITPGEENSAETDFCPTPGPPRLVINEIDYDQPSADTAEFVEIFNAGDGVADLNGVTLELVNGSDGLPYDTVALPAMTLASGEYFVVCADALTVPNCDLEGFSSIQNGAPDAVALMFEGAIVDTVSYEGDVVGFVEGSGVGLEDSGSTGEDNKGISRVPDGTDTEVNNVDLTFVCVTPGGANTSLTTSCTASGPAFEIFEIQGAGAATPFDGQTVTTLDNIVTAVGPEGFFIQTPAARSDLDVDTSDGVFVFTNSAPTVAVGDAVDVSGVATEFFDFTEISSPSVTVLSSGNALPAAVIFDATVPSPDPTAPSCAIEFECYEGMLVSITGGTVTGPNQSFGTDPIAEVHITAASTRTFREPGMEFPGMAGFPVWDGNPEVFELDADALGLPNDLIPGGSSFDAVGVIGFEFGGYELFPSSLTVTPATIPDPVRPRAAGESTVASLNLFRLFDDIDDPSDTNIFGETRDDTVVSTLEYDTRRIKFADHIVNVLDSPDVLAVQEAEKLGVLEDLAAEIALLDATVVYSAILLEGNDIGTIDVGFLVRDTVIVDAVTQLGLNETFINPNDGLLDILNDRPPLQIDVRCQTGSGEVPLTVISVHGRSLSGIDDARVQQKRFEQAQSLAQKIQDLQVIDPAVNVIALGDYNAFEFTDGFVDVVGFVKGDFVAADNLVCDTNTCTDLVDPNLTNVVDTFVPLEERYSFNFGGNAQTLDHALISQALVPIVSGAEFGRGNSDGAEILIEDDTTPITASDHDGLVVYVTKLEDEDSDGVEDAADFCPGTMIPERVPTEQLGPNRYALVDGDFEFDKGTPAAPDDFSTSDTAGCSCEQIIKALQLAGPPRQNAKRFGCHLGLMRSWVNMVSPPAN